MPLPTLNASSRLRYFTFFYLYVMQGIPAGFALTAISNYLSGKHVSPQQVGTFVAMVGPPWTVQFIWGPLIDRFQFSSMGHRKHWVVIAQWLAIIASLGLFMVSDPHLEIPLLGVVFLIHSIFASIQDASVDAMAISIAPLNERGKINGFMRGGFLLGMAFGAAVLSTVIHHYNFKTAVLVQVIVLTVLSLIFLLTKVDEKDSILPTFRRARLSRKEYLDNPTIRSLFEKIYHGITRRKSLYYFIFIAWIYFTASVFIRSFTYHLIAVLNWRDESVSLLQGGWGSIITFTAILIAGATSDKIGAKKMQILVMWGIGIFLLMVSAGYSLWTNHAFSGTALVMWNFADPLLSVCVFPILMSLCLEKVEGSQFTAYLALVNLCDVLGSYLTGWMLTITTTQVISLMCAISFLTVLLFVRGKGKYQLIPE